MKGKRGRPAQPQRKLLVRALVDAQIAAGNYPNVPAACEALSQFVGRPGGTLTDAGVMTGWPIMACAGADSDTAGAKTWEANYTDAVALATGTRRKRGRPPKPRGIS